MSAPENSEPDSPTPEGELIRRPAARGETRRNSPPKVVRVEQFYAGPLPPPHILSDYDVVVPGAAGRIIASFENQSSHRHSLEKAVVESNNLRAARGQTYGLTIGVVAIVCGSLVAIGGSPWAGAMIGGVPVAGLVLAFVKGTDSQRDEREKKARRVQDEMEGLDAAPAPPQ